MKLSICVVTMNREDQIAEAVRSCLSCELPQETEFVIIDNASTDNTEQIVKNILYSSGYKYYYEKMAENLGVGGGRNYAYNHAKGEFIYMLDDDAVIAVEKCKDFFIRAINVFETHPDVVSLTSQIYDTAWQRDRVDVCGSAIAKDIYRCFMFCGGSHFLRKTFYNKSPYLHNKYGYEELPPSLIAVDKGKVNAFCPDLLVIHKPAVNKWNYTEDNNMNLLICGIVLPYVIKKMMYPKITYPLIYLFYNIRKKMYLPDFKSRCKADETMRKFKNDYSIDYKISFKTFCNLVSTFNKTAL